MSTKYLDFKKMGMPEHVYIPFGDNTDYNRLVLDYNISSNGGSWEFEFYDKTLGSEIPVTLEVGDDGNDYKIKYMGAKYNGKLVGSNISTDILDINLKNAVKYKLTIFYQEGNYPIDEIVSFIYNFFNWHNVSIQYEIDKSEKELNLYISTNIGYINYDDSGNYWGVCNNGLNLDALCYRTAQLSQYYRKILGNIEWFHVKLSTWPHMEELGFYNGDHTRLGRASRFRLIDSLRPYLYRDKKNSYSDSVKEYYYRLYEWISKAIELGKEFNYSKDYFTDLRNATNELVSPEFRQIVSDGEENSKDKERILSLGIYDKTAFDLGLINIDESDNTSTTESFTVDIEELNKENVKTNSSNIDNKKVDKGKSSINSDNIMEKVKESMKNMSTLIDRM